jgi:hypothetical protein
LAANGKMGGFSARGGVSTKLRMLNIEQAGTGNTPTLFGNLPLGMPPKRRPAPAQDLAHDDFNWNQRNRHGRT